MKISKISFFNIGSSFQGGQDYYDAIKPDGLIILYSDESYFLSSIDTSLNTKSGW